MDVSRTQLKRYAEVLAMWHSRFDTDEIGRRVRLPEHLVTTWIANYRDLMHGGPLDPMPVV
jgi:hypothetical protein